MRKIIQLSVGQSSEDITYLALCDDGTAWEYEWAKNIYKDIPPSDDKPYSSREKIGVTPATWSRLAPIPQEND